MADSKKKTQDQINDSWNGYDEWRTHSAVSDEKPRAKAPKDLEQSPANHSDVHLEGAAQGWGA